MKLLPDENLSHQLRAEILGQEVFTTAFMGWSGIDNGKLLALAADAGFDALITNDRGLEYQQNPASLALAVIVLLVRSNIIEGIRPLYPALNSTLESLAPCSLNKIK